MRLTANINVRMIQSLRAVAALMVVLLHCTEMWALRVQTGSSDAIWQHGAAGVDIFFVISGFIMTVSSRHLVGEPLGWLQFIKNRIVRIVPLYWLLTTLKLVAVVAAGGLVLRSELSPGFVAASYAFLPLVDSAGHFRPLLPVGWTLTFEFMFYLVFSFTLARKADALRVALPVLGAVAIVGLYRTDSWPVWTVLFDPIVLEFIFGIAIARLMLAGFRLPPALALFALFAGFAVIVSVAPAVENLRVVVWGLPAALIVAGAVSLERDLGHVVPKWLLAMGDASYSLYLSHGFFLAALGATIRLLGWTSPVAEGVTMIAGLAGSALVALAVYAAVEKPMLRMLRTGRLRPAAS